MSGTKVMTHGSRHTTAAVERRRGIPSSLQRTAAQPPARTLQQRLGNHATQRFVASSVRQPKAASPVPASPPDHLPAERLAVTDTPLLSPRLLRKATKGRISTIASETGLDHAFEYAWGRALPPVPIYGPIKGQIIPELRISARMGAGYAGSAAGTAVIRGTASGRVIFLAFVGSPEIAEAFASATPSVDANFAFRHYGSTESVETGESPAWSLDIPSLALRGSLRAGARFARRSTEYGYEVFNGELVRVELIRVTPREIVCGRVVVNQQLVDVLVRFAQFSQRAADAVERGTRETLSPPTYDRNEPAEGSEAKRRAREEQRRSYLDRIPVVGGILARKAQRVAAGVEAAGGATATVHRGAVAAAPARTLQECPENDATRNPLVRGQRKPAVSAPDDPLERQADVVADRVMRMSGPDVIQRTCKESEEEKEETPRIQRVESSPSVADVDVSAAVQATQRSGAPLPADVRSFFEPRFGHDFSGVRVHTGGEAARAARGAEARAYTLGRDIVFGAHEYAPGTTEGRRLLAHELAHVVQQGSAGPAIQRRILIGGSPYTPTAAYNIYLKTHFGDAMLEFVASMHNGGKPPDFSFDSAEQMGREVRVRAAAIKAMADVNVDPGCCNYPSGGGSGRLDPNYWEKKGPFQFVLRSKLPAGKQPSDAIEAIFKPSARTELECNSTMVAIQYRAMLRMLGALNFNMKFAGGVGLIISPHHVPPAGVARHPIWEKGLFQRITITGVKDLLPGDWVYFKNHPDYADKHPGGLWSGEHALYVGNGKFRGFGVAEQSEADLNKKLLAEYNKGLPVPDRKTSVPGLQDYARRPVISEVEKTGP